ncbi:MAG TPA: segregation/condensation protein A [Phycisphaerales bacterium]|nr:segregation/condensation protein A [Phycisphaerales bacterium]
MTLDDYRIKLDAFEGPLDLLLFLIRKNEVDLHDIPISKITDQYLAFVSQLHGADTARLDIDEAGEFLVMAATLTEIKSRMLLRKPGAAASADGGAKAPETDPREELVRQLLDYKRYRDAAELLERRGDEWSRRFGAGRAGVDDQALARLLDDAAQEDLDDLDLVELAGAFFRVAQTVNFERLGDHQVTYDDTPIELHAEDIVSRLQEHAAKNAERGVGEVELRDMIRGKTRSEMVGLFLALLELVRNRRVGVRQEGGSGTILLRLRPPEDAVVPPADATVIGDH